MSAARLNDIVRRAIAAGLLPPDAHAKPSEQRPWPVIALTALGGWLAALPILAAIALLLGDSLLKDGGLLVAGLLAVAAAVLVLRQTALALFVEQLAIPIFLAGCAALGVYIGDKGSLTMVCVCLALLSIVVALLVPRNWLRTLLGATACGLALGALMIDADGGAWASLLLALHLATVVWSGSQLAKRTLPLDAGGLATAHALDAMSMGWGAVTLAGLALYAGSTFLAGAIIPGMQGGFGPGSTPAASLAAYQIWHVISAGAAVGAAAHRVSSWPSLRQPWAAAVALVMVVLSLLMPTLGATLLVLAMCATGGRWAMAAAAGFAAAWIIGAYYYQVSLPFATKAVIMIVAGTVLGASAWFSLRGAAAPHNMHTSGSGKLRSAAGLAVTALAVFAVANLAIWQKEDIIANGKPVFVELGPVDPRSLMQGDYMTLRFRLPGEIRFASDRKAIAVGQLDARGVLTITRADDGSALAADELRIALTAGSDGATIVSNAWYFREGEAERFAAARYGEFRVMHNGRALLVGMRGPNLEPL